MDGPIHPRARNGCHFLPQFFGDERNDGVGQAQNGFQRADQGAAGGPFLRVVPVWICTLAISRYQSQNSFQTKS
jgi:hypothetical protein